MRIRPELKQIVWNILAEENLFDTTELTLIVNKAKWTLDELKMLTRVSYINYRKVLKQIELGAQEAAKATFDFRGDHNGSSKIRGLSADRSGVF